MLRTVSSLNDPGDPVKSLESLIGLLVLLSRALPDYEWRSQQQMRPPNG